MSKNSLLVRFSWFWLNVLKAFSIFTKRASCTEMSNLRIFFYMMASISFVTSAAPWQSTMLVTTARLITSHLNVLIKTLEPKQQMTCGLSVALRTSSRSRLILSAMMKIVMIMRR